MQGKQNMQDYTGQELNDSLESTPKTSYSMINTTNFMQHTTPPHDAGRKVKIKGR